MRGNSERAIAEMVRAEAVHPGSPLRGCEKTTHITVHLDVEACREEWVKRDGCKLDEKRTEQVSRLLDIVHQAWVDFTNKAEYLRPQYLRIALDAEEKLAKLMGTLAPVQLTGGEGEPLMPPTVIFQWPDGTEFKPPRNGHEPIEVKASGNGDEPDRG